MAGKVPIDNDALVVTSLIQRTCQLSLLEVLIGVGLHASIYSNDVSMCARICAYTIYSLHSVLIDIFSYDTMTKDILITLINATQIFC